MNPSISSLKSAAIHSPDGSLLIFISSSTCFGCESKQLYNIFSVLASVFTDFFMTFRQFLQSILKKSRISSGVCKSAAPCLISPLHPSLNGSLTRPGTAKTSFPCYRAISAVIREPLRFLASITITASESPLIIRFLKGKLRAAGFSPGPYSEITPPVSRIAL